MPLLILFADYFGSYFIKKTEAIRKLFPSPLTTSNNSPAPLPTHSAFEHRTLSSCLKISFLQQLFPQPPVLLLCCCLIFIGYKVCLYATHTNWFTCYTLCAYNTSSQKHKPLVLDLLSPSNLSSEQDASKSCSYLLSPLHLLFQDSSD